MWERFRCASENQSFYCSLSVFGDMWCDLRSPIDKYKEAPSSIRGIKKERLWLQIIQKISFLQKDEWGSGEGRKTVGEEEICGTEQLSLFWKCFKDYPHHLFDPFGSWWWWEWEGEMRRRKENDGEAWKRRKGKADASMSCWVSLDENRTGSILLCFCLILSLSLSLIIVLHIW